MDNVMPKHDKDPDKVPEPEFEFFQTRVNDRVNERLTQRAFGFEVHSRRADERG